MLQASDELRAKFPSPDGDWKALDILKLNFTNNKGVLRPKIRGYKPTECGAGKRITYAQLTKGKTWFDAEESNATI